MPSLVRASLTSLRAGVVFDGLRAREACAGQRHQFVALLVGQQAAEDDHARVAHAGQHAHLAVAGRRCRGAAVAPAIGSGTGTGGGSAGRLGVVVR